MEELRRDSEAPKFRAREPTVLKEKPFTVQKKPTVLIQQPFNLISERRIQQRKLFEEMFRKEKEEKERKVSTNVNASVSKYKIQLCENMFHANFCFHCDFVFVAYECVVVVAVVVIVIKE